ncbi:MFS transporter [Streptococcus himalayensis]|uniref:ABC transporter permease n=1 Tax=Streptococcus himalayensis TaxID=1888195 RepID=A0A917EE39_9STRE|nr:MFS transporter [Streptococcus himalayensis]GGE30289.1 ABC transporter permease [Streptococcus himalayensis]
MNRQAMQLIARGAINKIGNMLYDYGNSVWLASLGKLGETVLGVYQISDLVTSLLVNPIGGVISDRFSRRKILMTTDILCAILCLGISCLSDQKSLIAGLIVANILQAIAFAFSRPANKSYITEIVAKEEIITYNAHLEMVLQVISVSAPVLSFLVLHYASLHVTLLVDGVTFLVAAALVFFLPNHELEKKETALTVRGVLSDIKAGLVYIRSQKEIFFLLLLASAVNFFFAAFNYLLPFTDHLYHASGSYATILTMGAIGSILGAVLSKKFKDYLENLSLVLAMTGLGVCLMALPVLFPKFLLLAFAGNLICELFMTIFNIHFFSQVQTKVDKHYMGRVFSTIYTLAILFMPIATFLMTITSSIHLVSFFLIGLAVLGLSLWAHLYQRRSLKD